MSHKIKIKIFIYGILSGTFFIFISCSGCMGFDSKPVDVLLDEQTDDTAQQDITADEEKEVGAEYEVMKNCVVDEDCDDNEICNGEENCSIEGECRAGSPPPDGTPCKTSNGNDGVCKDMHCLQEAFCGNRVIEQNEECDDGNGISNDGCESNCHFSCHTEEDCLSINPDTCYFVACVVNDNGQLCMEQKRENGYECNDNNVCTANEICIDGECTPQGMLLCDDRIDCTMNNCHPVYGCMYLPDNSLCDDSIDCTIDICNPPEGCIHRSNDSLCDDGNQCTIDSCDPYGSEILPDEHGCTHRVILNASCDDGLSCTSFDECNEDGICTGTVNPGFCLIDGRCYTGGSIDPRHECKVCSPAINPLEWSNVTNGSPCAVCEFPCPCSDSTGCSCCNGICGNYNETSCPPLP